MERVGTWRVCSEEVTRGFDFAGTPIQSWALTGLSGAGFLPRNRRCGHMIDKTYQPAAVEGRIYASLGGGGRVPRRPAGAARRQALLHRHPAAERHRLAAYGPRAQQHAAGHARAASSACAAATCCGSPAPTMPASPPRWWSSASSWSARSRTGARIGREKFLERVWAWKAESGGTIVNQLKRLGASCDWSRERFTMDEGLSRAVLKVFVELYREGLIYKDKRLVNWDPKLQTAISDLEVQQVEVKGQSVALPLSDRRRAFDPAILDLHHGRDHAARDDAGRHRGRGASGRRALPASRRQERDPAAGRPAHPDRRRRIFRSGEGHRRGQDHAGARLQRFRGRQAARPAADQHARRRGQGSILADNEAFLARRAARRPSSSETLACTASTASRRASASSRAWRRAASSTRSSRTPTRCRTATARAS